MEYVILPNLKFTLTFITNPSNISPISIRNLELAKESKNFFFKKIKQTKKSTLLSRSTISYKCLTFCLLSEFINVEPEGLSVMA